MSSRSRKYAKSIVDIDVLLRQRAVGGSRIRVSYTEVAEALSIGSSTASAALLALLQIPNSGLKRVKQGQYEYVTPDVFPPDLKVLKDGLRENREPVRKGLSTEVIAYLNEHRGELVTIQTVSAALDAHDGSVNAILNRLADAGELEIMFPVLARGTFRVPARRHDTYIIENLSGIQKELMDGIVDDNLPNGDAALVSGQLSRSERKAALLSDITGQSPKADAPSPLAVASRVAPIMEKATGPEPFYKQVGTTKSGKVILRAPDGTIGVWTEME
jgi:hypothetical protein